MKRSSKAPVTGVPKLDNPRSGKDCKMHLSNIGKREALINISAQRIQRAWLCHMDRTIFKLLKHTICAVEHCVTYEILKKVSPLEAELLKDPSMKCKVRFRFSGETFPPFIVFKIFLHTEGHGYKYFSGKNLFKPSSEGVVDGCKMMGKKKFYHQVMEDQHLFQKLKITDEIDIVTLKDYMKQTDTPSTKQRQTIIFSTPSFDIVKVDELIPDEELEKQEKELFAWYQDLCINSSQSC
uniref:Uncharacterized protein n=1 Tax=Ailuropoda melanoleuca TaxID=9646 RepID=G1M252_AILME